MLTVTVAAALAVLGCWQGGYPWPTSVDAAGDIPGWWIPAIWAGLEWAWYNTEEANWIIAVALWCRLIRFTPEWVCGKSELAWPRHELRGRGRTWMDTTGHWVLRPRGEDLFSPAGQRDRGEYGGDPAIGGILPCHRRFDAQG